MQRPALPRAGFTLLELLIGLAVGLFVLASASMLMLAQLGDHRRLTLETRTEQDLRALAELMGRELREAGRWQSPAQGVWQEAAAAIANPYADIAVAPDGSRIEFSLSSAEPLSRDDNLLTPAERRGFKLEAGVLRFLQGGAGWQPLSDPQTLRLNSLRFELREQAQTLPELCERACDSLADCPPRLLRQQLRVQLQGQAAHDGRVQRRLDFSLPLQTERVEGRCHP
jgi:prepilin peptidase dependent protein B